MLGALSVDERYATPSSWHFEVLVKHPQYPNVAAKVGTVDVHYPCAGDIRFHATVCLDPKYIAVEKQQLPAKEVVVETVLRAFEVSKDELWSVLYLHYARGEQTMDNRAYYS